MASTKEFKVGKVEDLTNYASKEVDVGKQKALLTLVDGKVYATAPRCTHYGAPLIKGVVTPDGKIVCPWHAACFKLETGDIEDAPALDALPVFPVRLDGEDIYVTIDEAALESGKKRPCPRGDGQTMKPDEAKAKEHTVIVGGGSAGMGAAQGLREFGYPGKITVVSKENSFPIDRTKLSKELSTDVAKLHLRDAKFFDELQVDFKHGLSVKSVDTASKKITTDGGDAISYDNLILAPGGAANNLKLDGFDLKGVYKLRGILDTTSIASAKFGGKKRIAVIGSSFIGMEVATCLVKEGHNVIIIGKDQVPLSNIVGDKVGHFLQKSQEKKGIEFKMGVDIESGIPDAQDKSKIGGIKLKSGEVIVADFVILGVGVHPDTDFLKESGFKLEKDGSVAVDKYLRVEGKENVYAVGDIATFPYHGGAANANGQNIRIEHWDVAMNHGRVAAQNISGHKVAFDKVPYFWSAQGSPIRYCGNTAGGYDDIVLQGSMEEEKFVAFYTQGQHPVAVLTVNSDPVAAKCTQLFHKGKMPSKDELMSGRDVLKIEL